MEGAGPNHQSVPHLFKLSYVHIYEWCVCCYVCTYYVDAFFQLLHGHTHSLRSTDIAALSHNDPREGGAEQHTHTQRNKSSACSSSSSSWGACRSQAKAKTEDGEEKAVRRSALRPNADTRTFPLLRTSSSRSALDNGHRRADRQPSSPLARK